MSKIEKMMEIVEGRLESASAEFEAERSKLAQLETAVQESQKRMFELTVKVQGRKEAVEILKEAEGA